VIASEGHIVIALVVLFCALMVGVALFLPPIAGLALVVLALALVAFTLYFFRDPVRVSPQQVPEGSLLLAPADGRVVFVGEVDEPIFLKERARQVSIFLSPLDVHVNRVPADGVIEYVNYVPGEYLVAWHPKASDKNERSEIGLVHPAGIRILFKQIAGAVARRIVYHVEVGDVVRAGQRFGIVRFGSRMDVLVPLSVEITTVVGERVTAGVSVIGRILRPRPQAESSAAAQIAK